ncbi:MAG TPA: fibronectin type III domain-containing protein, partial [Chitinophagaceae bacterium]|nr:fibronectin type III domain-containing protein [Chitinophagaceae bacterium]
MKSVMMLLALFFGMLPTAMAQSGVLDPNDPIVVYDPAAPPATPAWGQMKKWVKTNRLSWNTASFKAYFYKNIAFRLKFPKSYQHGVSDGKTYPLYIFFHGIGEKGSIYDNEYQLYHGGKRHSDAVEQGKFDGFLLYAQNQGGYFGAGHYDIIKEIIENYLVPQVKVDINRVIVDGLSGGGQSTWDFMLKFPTLTAAALPISAASLSYGDEVQAWKYIPVWHFQGGLDNAPHPNTSYSIRDKAVAAGANYKLTVYPNEGHGCWNTAWAEADYFPYLLRAHKANPWPLTGRTEFCPGDPINVTMGITPGFNGYEWRKNGVLIAGATTNQITVNSVGTYECRFLRGSVWSPWSPRPVEIKIKAPTVSPAITVDGLMSKVIPAPDGNTSVRLKVPEGYASYQWQRVGSNTTLGTANVLTAAAPGDYRVKVTEQFGCSSDFSAAFTVVDANGPNKPDAAINLVATAVSKTEIKLDWSDNPAPAYNETNFEVYQASQSGGPYQLIALKGANVVTHTVSGLNAKTPYYFIVRAVNGTGAAAPTPAATATTQADVTPPTAPANLRLAGSTRNAIALSWDAASDDVGVTRYEIYINGQRAYGTTGTTLTAYNLEQGKTYNFQVKAKDFAGNLSAYSNQLTAQAVHRGLNYKYYHGSWDVLPNFATLSPVKTGMVLNINRLARTQNDEYGFLYEGVVNIPVAGSYTFRIGSGDGAKLYLGALNATASPYGHTATALINNDGIHGNTTRDGTRTLQPGLYPIAITYFDKTGSDTLFLHWRTPSSGGVFVPVPNDAFAEPAPALGPLPAAPVAPAATAVSYKQINLTWTDNSNNETGFEVWRSTHPVDGFNTVALLSPNSTSFQDTTVAPNTTYYYRVRAINANGSSAFDSEGAGLDYQYYEVASMTALPSFNTLTHVKTGRVATPVLGIQNRVNDFAVKYSGKLRITTGGTYTFYTASDEGSKLYIGAFDEASLVVNNDGLHTKVEKSGTRTLAPGIYDF